MIRRLAAAAVLGLVAGYYWQRAVSYARDVLAIVRAFDAPAWDAGGAAEVRYSQPSPGSRGDDSSVRDSQATPPVLPPALMRDPIGG